MITQYNKLKNVRRHNERIVMTRHQVEACQCLWTVELRSFCRTAHVHDIPNNLTVSNTRYRMSYELTKGHIVCMRK